MGVGRSFTLKLYCFAMVLQFIDFCLLHSSTAFTCHRHSVSPMANDDIVYRVCPYLAMLAYRDAPWTMVYHQRYKKKEKSIMTQGLAKVIRSGRDELKDGHVMRRNRQHLLNILIIFKAAFYLFKTASLNGSAHRESGSFKSRCVVCE